MEKSTCNDNKFVTMGCRLNIHETHEIKKNISDQQNLVVINTCCVTKEALRKSKQNIRKAIRDYPNKNIIVTGCAAQLYLEQIKSIKGIAKIVDNKDKLNPALYRIKTSSTNLIYQQPKRPKPPEQPEQPEQHTRAFVKIQNGCDHTCTFCIIPYARGNSISTPEKIIIEKITQLCDLGYQECVLTGVDITAYGNDLEEKTNIGTLITNIIQKVPALKRLRLSSVDCAEIPQQLLECLGEETLMPHLHLSMQAGDDLILKRMKRRHSRDQAIEFCHKVRQLRPDIVFGADFIAGFPTETDKHFENTIDLVKQCDITLLHIFPFSPHPKTPAARMPQIPRNIIKQRAEILRNEGKKIKIKFMNKLKNTKQKILLENNNIAYTPQFIPVKYQGTNKIGQIVEATIKEHDGNYLTAEINS